MIIAITTVRNGDGDLIAATMMHLLDQGVGRLLVIDRSTDGTSDILKRLRETSGLHTLQIIRITSAVCECNGGLRGEPPPLEEDRDCLSALARAQGARWILPFEARAYWMPMPPYKTLAAALASVKGPAALSANVYRHNDMRLREAMLVGVLNVFTAKPVVGGYDGLVPDLVEVRFWTPTLQIGKLVESPLVTRFPPSYRIGDSLQRIPPEPPPPPPPEPTYKGPVL